MAFNTKTFITRTASAAVFVFVLLSCVWYNFFSFVGFFTVVGIIGLYEFCKLAEKLSAHPNKWILFILHLSFIISTTLYFLIKKVPILIFISNIGDATMIFFGLFILTFFSLFILELFRSESNLLNIGYSLLAFLYVSLPCSLIIALGISNDENFQPQKVLGMIFFIWINDTGAYLVGSFLGKYKLYEKISPNKTWEGTIGGIILCIALSFVMVKLFPQLELKHWIVISVIVAVFGTLGDLVESMLKRMAGVKDTGNIMPGHGGVLDRFDSLLFSTPFVFCYLAAVGLL